MSIFILLMVHQRHMWEELDEGFWERNRSSKVDAVTKDVIKIIDQVKAQGDKALIELTKRFDKVDIDSVIVTRDEIDDAYDEVEEDLIEALEAAAVSKASIRSSLTSS